MEYHNYSIFPIYGINDKEKNKCGKQVDYSENYIIRGSEFLKFSSEHDTEVGYEKSNNHRDVINHIGITAKASFYLRCGFKIKKKKVGQDQEGEKVKQVTYFDCNCGNRTPSVKPERPYNNCGYKKKQSESDYKKKMKE
jgi:hypothetical protein